jgi:hypothetical protein
MKVRLPYRGADKSLARSTSLSFVFSFQGTGGSPTGPDPENRVGDQDSGSPGRPVSSGLQVPGERFLPGRAKDLSVPLYYGTNKCEPTELFLTINRTSQSMTINKEYAC